MLPPVSLCLVPAILTSTLFLFSAKWREEVTPLRSVTTQQIAKHHDQRHVTPARRARARPHLRMRARSGARAHAHPHTNVHCAHARTRKHARSRTLTFAGVPAPRPAPVAYRRRNARRARADAKSIQSRWSAVAARFGGAAPHGKPSMPKHIVGP